MEHQASTSIERSVALVWREREKAELEAAGMFGALAEEMRKQGVPDRICRLAETACADERRHASLCRSIVDALAPDLRSLKPNAAIVALRGLEPERQVLYASVAMGCITETLSSALLLRMREVTTEEPCREVVASILRDEIAHTHVGWAHLAWAAELGDVSWLSTHISEMLAAAVDEAAVPRCDALGYSRYGILGAAESDSIVQEALKQVIGPGLGRYGILPNCTRN